MPELLQIVANLPVINKDLTESFRKIEEILLRSIRLNFLMGGRPDPWAPAKRGGTDESGGNTPLVLGGALYNSIRGESGYGYAEVIAGEGLPYARIHQYGGFVQIPISKKSRRFFWAMFYKTLDERWKWMALTERSVFIIYIPPRPYMVLQDVDLDLIIRIVQEGVLYVSDIRSTATITL